MIREFRNFHYGVSAKECMVEGLRAIKMTEEITTKESEFEKERCGLAKTTCPRFAAGSLSVTKSSIYLATSICGSNRLYHI